MLLSSVYNISLAQVQRGGALFGVTTCKPERYRQYSH